MMSEYCVKHICNCTSSCELVRSTAIIVLTSSNVERSMLVAGCRTLTVMSAIRFLVILFERRANRDLDLAVVGKRQRQREAVDPTAHEIRPRQAGQAALTALAL